VIAGARVVLAEPDTPTRVGVRVALTRSGFKVVAEARDAAGAVEAAIRERPELAVIAVDLPGDGIDATRAIATRLRAIRIVVLTGHQNGRELVAAVLAGASGYLRKDMNQSRLPHAVEGVLAGEAAVPRRYTEHILEVLRGRHARRGRVRPHMLASITDRQWEVLDLLADGTSTAEMARRLGISEVTARRHISSVLRKLGLKDRAEAVELMREGSPD
jgi:DNA-binding NarL/FixJ family response regulator